MIGKPDIIIDGITNSELILHPCSSSDQRSMGLISSFTEHKESMQFGWGACNLKIDLIDNTHNNTKVWFIPAPESLDLYKQFKQKCCGGTFKVCPFYGSHHKSYLPSFVKSLDHGVKWLIYFQKTGQWMLNASDDEHHGFSIGKYMDITMAANFVWHKDQLRVNLVMQKYNESSDRLTLLKRYGEFGSMPSKDIKCYHCDYQNFHGYYTETCIYEQDMISGKYNVMGFLRRKLELLKVSPDNIPLTIDYLINKTNRNSKTSCNESKDSISTKSTALHQSNQIIEPNAVTLAFVNQQSSILYSLMINLKIYIINHQYIIIIIKILVIIIRIQLIPCYIIIPTITKMPWICTIKANQYRRVNLLCTHHHMEHV